MTNYSEKVLAKIAKIESICSQDVGRGIEPLAQFTRGELCGAAKSLAEHSSPHVAIMTGFFIPHGNPPAAETDGPIAAAHLAAGLIRAGIPVKLVSDRFCLDAVKIAAEAAKVPADTAFDVLGEDVSQVTSILNSWERGSKPISHLISIERAGPSFDGKIRNMKGKDITAYTAPLHLLFSKSNATTIAIGDGGNELGMGKLPLELVINNISQGEKITCVIPSDYLIVCGVSNWGGLGLLAALSLLRPDLQANLTKGLNSDTDYRILQTLIEQKVAVDGVTGLPTLSVDNLPWEVHRQVLEYICQAADLT
ncbi:MAG: DUF4392 domain-containing protein [Oscillatoria sp. PMC 1051.18]|nr:DUF4392 domain-containing protein [Oscillatoria sp. PMC 1050.18]MEC5032806.1 DUF4392 domain-containing protein [Oscillatoria sp. PMC 1051.18]